MDDTATVQMNSAELIAVANALNEVLHGPSAIDGWEFQTRMGVTRTEAKRLCDEMSRVLR
jgi:hypothetical protein